MEEGAAQQQSPPLPPSQEDNDKPNSEVALEEHEKVGQPDQMQHEEERNEKVQKDQGEACVNEIGSKIQQSLGEWHDEDEAEEDTEAGDGDEDQQSSKPDMFGLDPISGVACRVMGNINGAVFRGEW
jgi:hypothetical protein